MLNVTNQQPGLPKGRLFLLSSIIACCDDDTHVGMAPVLPVMELLSRLMWSSAKLSGVVDVHAYGKSADFQ